MTATRWFLCIAASLVIGAAVAWASASLTQGNSRYDVPPRFQQKPL